MKTSTYLTAVSLILGLVFAAPNAGADEEPANTPRRERDAEDRERAAGKYWLGVQTAPVDRALQSHLKIQDRLMVENVVPDSPADKAGLQRYDIILAFGGEPVETIRDLVTAVGKSEGDETAVMILRGGKETSLKVQPSKRPERYSVVPDARGFLRPLERWIDREQGEEGTFDLRILGPGVVTRPGYSLPEGVSVRIEKESDEPAMIVVRRGDEKWEVTEETIDELPEDIRSHVKRFLGRGTPGAFGGRLRWDEDFELPGRLGEEGLFKQLRKELESLRREFEQFRDREDHGDEEAEGGRDV